MRRTIYLGYAVAALMLFVGLAMLVRQKTNHPNRSSMQFGPTVLEGDVSVVIGEGMSVTLTIDHIARPQLIGVVSNFLSNNHPEAVDRFKEVLAKSKKITFVLQSSELEGNN